MSVAREIIKREPTGSLAYPKAGGIRSVVILADQPAGAILEHDVRTETRRAFPRDAFERAVAQGDALWTT